MNPHLKPGLGGSQAGFTLVELIIIIVVVGIMSAYAVMKSVSPSDATLPSQAQKLASNIRHAQTLAYTSGQRMKITINPDNVTYSVNCVTGATPCATDFSDGVEKNVTLGGAVATGDGTLSFNSLGQPLDSLGASASVSYTLTSSGGTATVCVAALTGFVKVAPPETCP